MRCWRGKKTTFRFLEEFLEEFSCCCAVAWWDELQCLTKLCPKAVRNREHHLVPFFALLLMRKSWPILIKMTTLQLCHQQEADGTVKHQFSSHFKREKGKRAKIHVSNPWLGSNDWSYVKFSDVMGCFFVATGRKTSWRVDFRNSICIQFLIIILSQQQNWGITLMHLMSTECCICHRWFCKTIFHPTFCMLALLLKKTRTFAVTVNFPVQYSSKCALKGFKEASLWP